MDKIAKNEPFNLRDCLRCMAKKCSSVARLISSSKLGPTQRHVSRGIGESLPAITGSVLLTTLLLTSAMAFLGVALGDMVLLQLKRQQSQQLQLQTTLLAAAAVNTAIVALEQGEMPNCQSEWQGPTAFSDRTLAAWQSTSACRLSVADQTAYYELSRRQTSFCWYHDQGGERWYGADFYAIVGFAAVGDGAYSQLIQATFIRPAAESVEVMPSDCDAVTSFEPGTLNYQQLRV